MTSAIRGRDSEAVHTGSFRARSQAMTKRLLIRDVSSPNSSDPSHQVTTPNTSVCHRGLPFILQ